MKVEGVGIVLWLLERKDLFHDDAERSILGHNAYSFADLIVVVKVVVNVVVVVVVCFVVVVVHFCKEF